MYRQFSSSIGGGGGSARRDGSRKQGQSECACKRTILRLKKHEPFLRRFIETKARGGNCLDILNRANKTQAKCILEIIKNISLGNVPLPVKHVKKLRYFKDSLYALADKRVSNGRKRKILANQKGGGFFLPFLASVVLPLAIDLVIDKFRSK